MNKNDLSQIFCLRNITISISCPSILRPYNTKITPRNPPRVRTFTFPTMPRYGLHHPIALVVEGRPGVEASVIEASKTSL
jgi:hypothetical protein